MSGSEVVVSWREARLTRDDVALFNEGQWLNDACITFFFQHLLRKHGPAMDRVLLMDAESVFWLANEDDPEELADAAENLGLRGKDLILCPINDNADVTSAGGSHWTLLVARAAKEVASGSALAPLEFEHYDSVSSAGANLATAQRVAKCLAELRCGTDAARASRVAQGTAARQANGCDCGVYVLLFAEAVLEAHLRGATGSAAVAEKTA
eukprot:CAMPEP_0180753446 /NCGR_PEP_ID=MMETSP1038_2-20121128/32670_1 /TAXON_ID=632150 /ORGANISM="Azadinium spinosum, Strain 3D9" /LENGTH=209 /DNA_ID=CAMNT_0022787299 /DNA_START=58 /DNA_END=683 /DNA_ORIENTATION=+